MGQSILLGLLHLLTYCVVLLLVCRTYWSRFKRQHPDGNFHYRITDIWAAMLGLAPSWGMITFWVKQLQQTNFSEHRDVLNAIFGCALLVVSQIAGLFVGRIDIELSPHDGARSGWQSAVSIITGALLGLVIFVVCNVFLGFNLLI